MHIGLLGKTCSLIQVLLRGQCRVDGAPTDLTYVSVWACRYITIVFPIIGKADVFIGEAWPKEPL